MLVTGAASGIGRAIARRFAGEGACVTAVDLRMPLSRIPSVTDVVADVTDLEAMHGVVEMASSKRPLDICIANAGVFLEYSPFLHAAPTTWETVLHVNVTGVLITFQAAAQVMVGSGTGGRLIATSSITGLRGEPGWPAYSASKAATIAIVESLAAELAPHGIRVNAVAPGEVDTPYHEEVKRRVLEHNPTHSAAGLSTANRPIPRMATVDEVAAVFAFLASSDASYITGTAITVDGGALLTEIGGMRASAPQTETPFEG